MLPHADEIRALRTNAKLAENAHRALGVLATETLTAEILLSRAELRGDAEPTLPGLAHLAELAAEFPGVDAPTHPTGTAVEQLTSLLDQLRRAASVLRPIAKESEALAKRIHDLQHHQTDETDETVHADDLATLRALAHRRDEIVIALSPLQSAHARMHTIPDRLDEFSASIREHVAKAARDPRERPEIAFGALRIATICLSTVRSMLEGGLLDVPLPEAPSTAGLDRAGALAAAGGIADELARLRIEMADAVTRQQAQITSLRAEYVETERKMMEITG